jgi:hypothetical protein
VSDLTVERALVPRIDPPSDLPDGWAIRHWHVTTEYWSGMSLSMGFVHVPTGVEAEIVWEHAAPGMDFSWAREYLAFVASCPLGVFVQAAGRPPR